MYYEVYLDRLFLINFLMNLFCLGLANLTLESCASGRRVLAGAVFGAVLYLVPFLLPGNGLLKMVLGFFLSASGMILLTFPVGGLEAGIRAALRLFLCTFLMGGCELFLIRLFPAFRKGFTSILGILGIGLLLYGAVIRLVAKSGKADSLCRVFFRGDQGKVGTMALLDTGNSLIEPISGRPVCILEKEVFDQIWQEEKSEGFRAIPYHSIGRKRGILPGYLIPELCIDLNGMLHRCRNVYVGVVEGKLSGGGEYEMILNPKVLKEGSNDHQNRIARKIPY